MIEITLSDLNKSSFYEQTLQTIEQICDNYDITNEFGTLSMANQMVFDYLEKSYPQFNVDVEFQRQHGVAVRRHMKNAMPNCCTAIQPARTINAQF